MQFFNLTNLAHLEICFMKYSKFVIDLILTSKPLRFQKTYVIETRLSSYHKMTSTLYKACRVYSSSLLRATYQIRRDVCLGRSYHFRWYKGCLPQILLGPFLNTLTKCFILKINSIEIRNTTEVDLLGLTINYKMKFDADIDKLCKTARFKLYALHITMNKQS